MKEKVFLLFTCGMIIILLYSISPTHADSGDVTPPPAAKVQRNYCYGNANFNTNTDQWSKESVDCSLSDTSCKDSEKVVIGVSKSCCSTDWLGSCSSSCCYIICAPISTPKDNCKWE